MTITPVQTILFTFALCIFFAACTSDSDTVTEQDEYGNTITYERRKKDFARHGVYRVTNAQGVVVETAEYRADTLDGVRTLFSETGDTSVVEHYKNGRFEGPYYTYHATGKLRQKGQYINNVMAGKWYTYYEDGSVKEEATFVENEENGPFKEYHPNGNLAAEGSYINGDNEHGELKLYDEAGALRRTMQCDHGRCTTTWSVATTDTNQ